MRMKITSRVILLMSLWAFLPARFLHNLEHRSPCSGTYSHFCLEKTDLQGLDDDHHETPPISNNVSVSGQLALRGNLSATLLSYPT
jgi:hypothetical protein